jgi:hypothetical protein
MRWNSVVKLWEYQCRSVFRCRSSHSLRVGACIVLHAHRFTGPKIQFLLRWKSDAFMAYLRNLGFLVAQQNVALSASCDMPNLL